MEIKQNDFIFLIKEKSKLLFITFFIINLASAFITFFVVPIKYTSESIVAPVYGDDSSSGSSSLSSLAALGGFSIGSSNSDIPRHLVGLEIMKSKSFFKEISNTQFLKDLHEIDYYSFSANKNIYKNKKNTNYRFEDSHDRFLKALTVKKNRESGIITISITHQSPKTSQEWLRDIIDRTNSKLRNRDLIESENSINFLKSIMYDEKDIEVRKIFNELLKEELSNLLLVNKNLEYAFEVIDPPSFPTRKSYPSRLNLLIMGFIVSLMVSFVVLIAPKLSFFKKPIDKFK